MKAKLTLTLHKYVIEKAKEYAAAREMSLSDLVESYLKTLVSPEESIDYEKFPISPFVRSMAKGNSLPADFDYKTAYREHLIEKHK